MMCPLMVELAAEGIPVALSRRVLDFTKQAFYARKTQTVSQRDWEDAYLVNVARDVHTDDSAFRY